MASLWTAFDLSTLSGNVETALGVGVVITLGFLGYKMIKKVTGKM